MVKVFYCTMPRESRSVELFSLGKIAVDVTLLFTWVVAAWCLSSLNSSNLIVTRGVDSDNDGRKKQWREHCKKPWHTNETCWKLHGKPANWKPKSKRDGRAYQATAEDSQEPFIH
ncbi:hypothetical protein F0562_011723 [Nyssa sinensis]|uniref:Uncharacterized protein n=1 Tax=Nyssa sinensis TaxID=561372 RepID=A0A5J4ZTF0_9ASTE|nr:hypothetical protein F0562_011723 [Nyssa sinensis]